MIVEFIGSTGAGKTTLISEVQRRLADQAPVATSFGVVAELFGWRRVTSPTVQNIIQDFAGLPYFIGSLHQHGAFVTFALKTLARHRNSAFFTANYLRSIVRKIGTYEIVKQYNHDRIILVDEGTVLSAHLLFVFASTGYSQVDIETFASLVPLPELIVYVKAPVHSLVQRSLDRKDVRKEMRSKDPLLVARYVRQATDVFDRLTETDRVRGRVVIVSNPDSIEGGWDVVAANIATSILNCASGRDRISTISAGRMEPTSVTGAGHASQG
jgi:thymidylate kinase